MTARDGGALLLERVLRATSRLERDQATQSLHEWARQAGRRDLAGLASYFATDPHATILGALAEAVRNETRPDAQVADFDVATTRALVEVFLQEAQDNLDGAEESLREAVQWGWSDPLFDEVFRQIHTLKGNAATLGFPAIATATHQVEERLSSWQGREKTRDAEAFLKPLSLLRAMVDTVRLRGVGEALALRMPRLLDETAPTPSVRTVLVPRVTADRRLSERRDLERGLVRVPAESLDELFLLVGETVRMRARLERHVEEIRLLAQSLSQGQPGEVAGALQRVGGGLREDVDSVRRNAALMYAQLQRLRMVPAGLLFARVAQSLRTVAREVGKEVDIKVSGESVELDRALLAPMGEVLGHLARNAITHGIETPELRQAHEKPPVGCVRLTARHSDHVISLEISDDGAGIDPGHVRQSLVRGGRMSPEMALALADADALPLIFDAGFSTRPEADLLAGRGVGLDAVRSAVARAGGQISVESVVDRGASFTIRLPVRNTLVQALLFKVGHETYGIPAAYVADSTLVAAQEIERAEPGTPVRIGTRLLPLLRMRRLLGSARPADRPQAPVLVLRHGEREFAITCHDVIGAREIVMRSLGALLAPLHLYAGGTVSEDGEVHLIFDTAALADAAWARTMSPTVVDRSRPARLLLVDDSRVVRESFGEVLEGAGYVVDTAIDGMDAWDRLRARSFDLLITDLEMPRCSGYDLITQCRQEPSLSKMPIVVLTSQATATNRARARAAGATIFLAKSPSGSEFLEQIADLLGR